MLLSTQVTIEVSRRLGGDGTAVVAGEELGAGSMW